MPTMNQTALRHRIQELASVISSPAALLPTIGMPNDFAYPYVLIEGPVFRYLVREKGEILEDRETHDVETLLYWIFKRVTFNMAVEFEKIHRIPGQDFRRLLFSHQLHLLEALNPQWRAMENQEIDDVLVRAPYSDPR